MDPKLIDVFDTAQLIGLIGGVVIPFVVVLLTNARASANLKTAFAFLAAGLTALGVYLADADGAHTWKGAVSVFVVAFVIAATSRVAFTQQWVDKLAGKTADFGVGPTNNA